MNAIQIQQGDQYCATPTAESVSWIVSRFKGGYCLTQGQRTILDLLLAGFCLLFALGCGSTELPSPELQSRASELSALLISTQTVQTKSDEILKVVESNTTALAAIKASIDALPVVSKAANSEEVIQSTAPNPPAKANTALAPLKVATPGDFSEETLVELATRLYARGVNTNNKTREELEAIDAQLNGGQAVSGAMFQNNRTSAITSKRSAVRFVPRGSSVVQWPNYSTQQTCGPGGCPPRRSR
jgi:hypothetical protein